MQIKALVIHEKNGPYLLEDVELDEPKANEVLVRNVASGICHTDEFGRSQGVPIPLPLVLGHEGAGIVERVGSDVTDLKPGDHVGITYAFDGTCPSCRAHEPYYCENFNQINFGGVATDGTTRLHQNGRDVSMFFGQSSFATYSVANAASVAKVDDDVDLGIVAPLGCGVQTGAGAMINVAHVDETSAVAVFGCGAVGMSAIMGASVAGAKTIIAVGGNPKSLQLALELGATHVVNRKEVDDVPQAIRKICPAGVDATLDTSGNQYMMVNAIRSLKFHGTFLPVAAAGSIDHFDVGGDIMMPMRTMKGTCEGESDPKTFIPQMVRWYKEGRFPVDRILSFYDFADIDQALADSASGKIIKGVLRISQQ
ncbi:MAG: NAD(P)-dependent alcohol dehydrogenase [Olsenella sp.]|jgi:aryl-alcohol dehydrogenase|nr:NAD(P)-dependent alcohol dehydrogenase [Olsenella sp.]